MQFSGITDAVGAENSLSPAEAAVHYVLRSAAQTILDTFTPAKATHPCSCLTADEDGSWGVTALSCYSQLPNFPARSKRHTATKLSDAATSTEAVVSTTPAAEGKLVGMSENESLETVAVVETEAGMSQHENLDAIDGE
ncbi:MAG: hypothetical protein WDW38_006850 [Sanguina aurantia]